MKRYIRSDIVDIRDEDWLLKEELAKNSDTAGRTLSRLANDESEYIRFRVATNPNTPADALLQLVNDEYSEVRTMIAANPNINCEVAQALIDWAHANNEVDILEDIALNPKLPADVQRLLFSKTRDGGVLRCFAQNLCTIPEILRQLAKEEQFQIRLFVAENTSTPLDVLYQLGHNPDEDWEVLEAVAANPNSPEDLLIDIMNHHNAYFRGSANSYILSAIARNPNTSDELLQQIANDKGTGHCSLAKRILKDRQTQ